MKTNYHGYVGNKNLWTFVAALVLMAIVLLGCGETSDSGTESSEAEASANDETAESENALTETALEKSSADKASMTDSYREGRQAFYDATGIWLPEAAGFEAEYEVTEGSVCFDSHGDKELFEGAKAAISEYFGAPAEETEISADWHVDQGGNRENYNIYFDDSNPDEPWVYMNYYITQE